MIPTIMQQFLIDMGIRAAVPSQTVAKHSEFDQLDNGEHSIDVNEIEEYWNEYLSIIPNDLESVWDTVDNGLVRYLQVRSKKSNRIYLFCYQFDFMPFNGSSSQILKKRKQFSDECNFLRQQNAEITHLLQQYAKDELLKFNANSF